MWCERCQADVAGQAEPDNQHLRCTTCGAELPTGAAKVSRDPRELLEKWAREDSLDAVPSIAKTAAATSVQGTKPSVAADKVRTREPVASKPLGLEKRAASAAETNKGANTALKSGDPLNRLHQELRPQWWTARVGHSTAYLGVFVLSIGAGLVLLDYFGNHAGLAPYGWLATIAGQMLLFLGVVTLLSAGLEQSACDTARQLDRLGERLTRIELALDRLLLDEPSDAADEKRETGGPGDQRLRRRRAA